MKKLSWIVVMLVMFSYTAVAKEKEVDSKVTDVTVYPNHAQVTRHVNVDVVKGDNKFVFTSLVAVLDNKSV